MLASTAICSSSAIVHGMWGGNRHMWTADGLERLVDLCAIRTVSEGRTSPVSTASTGDEPFPCTVRYVFLPTTMLHTLTVDIDGKIYPCERYITDGRHALNDIVNSFSRKASKGHTGGRTWTPSAPISTRSERRPTGCRGLPQRPAADSLLYAARAKYQDRLDRRFIASGVSWNRAGEGRGMTRTLF